MAQTWSNRCEFETHFMKHDAFGYLGQMVYINGTGVTTIHEIMQLCADTRKYYTFDSNYCRPLRQCGVYKYVS